MTTRRAERRAYTIQTRHSTTKTSIPFDNDFNVIHTSEGTVRNVGGVISSVRENRSSQVVKGAWERMRSWDFPDDNEFALDKDGTLFNEAVEAEVMDEPPAVPLPVKKKKKNRSQVSVRLICESSLYHD